MIFLIEKKNGFWWILLLSLTLRFLRSSLFQFYVFFEMRLVPILVIIISFGNQPERLSAGSYLLFYTSVMSVPYLALIVIIDVLNNSIQSLSWVFFGTLIILLLPFFVKIPVFGVHFWLPKAHVEARTSGSIVLAGILLKLGRYGATRVVSLFIRGRNILKLRRFWIVLSFLSRLVTFLQRDIKKLVAYRRVTHITFIVVALCSFSKLTFISIVLVSLSHGWASIAMFMVAGSLSQSTFSRLGTIAGGERSLFWFFILFRMILVSNASIPPIPSFFPELFIMCNSLRGRRYSSLIFIILRFTVCYYNVFIFLWISHVKPRIFPNGKIFFLEGMILFLTVLLRIESFLFLIF